MITYRPTYMDFYWLYPCTLSSVSSELTLMLNKHIKATFKVGLLN